MKVGTDSLILGSLAEPVHARRILDIGTGSGLLALMMAQKSNANCTVDAVELDERAGLQAETNFAQSPWAGRLCVKQEDIARFEPDARYDLIISNPPYFAGHDDRTRAYETMGEQRKLARLENGLRIDDFFRHCARLLANEGCVYCVYPHQRHNDVINAASDAGFFVDQRWDVHNKADSVPKVSVYRLSAMASVTQIHSLTIRNEDNTYTDEYKILCQDFYVNF
ncbi:methyltransferase [Aestuariibacter sp. GS-14]|uniref:tRNA1(Val) (adenine(37)-N6)-methyltransferase n=1 Tax=Aestuariibacter sp. GS-14 TaxID=2590670 RepID=UPI0011272850|nr:methyltransferase [Aestuariibacter sp. GS-14]TPV56466.1 methyltransferase [Aestuariibacter sp. GS-14]